MTRASAGDMAGRWASSAAAAARATSSAFPVTGRPRANDVVSSMPTRRWPPAASAASSTGTEVRPMPVADQVERGLRRPSADILQQIAKGLRISAEALYIQAGFLEDKQPSSMVREAVLTDPDLTERQKQMVIEIYESFRKETRLAEGKDGEAADLPPDEAALTWPEDVGEDALDAAPPRPAIEPQQGGDSSRLAP